MTSIHVTELTKSYGHRRVVDHLGFEARPGRVTGFLGPNGSGKTTSMRILLGLADADSGTATFDGKDYASLPDPIHQVGAAIALDTFHPGRSAREHLRVMATAADIDHQRADVVLEMVGLSDAATRRVGGFSLGMKQRLSIAAALLGDPQVLVLDEPLNGLDPDGIVWFRSVVRDFADEGRTVLLSSHLLSEVELTVDDIVVIDHGRLVASGPLSELASTGGSVVRTPQTAALLTALLAGGHSAQLIDGEQVEVVGLTAAEVGRIAAAEGVVILALNDRRDGLERLFHGLTATHPNNNTNNNSHNGHKEVLA
jgi:ABC-2 type transport system ATP-binding protein